MWLRPTFLMLLLMFFVEGGTAMAADSAVPDFPVHSITVLAPEPEYVAAPGEKVDLKVAIRFAKAEKLDSPLVKYDVINRSGRVLVSDQVALVTFMEIGGRLDLSVTIPDTFSEPWLGVQLRGCIDGQRQWNLENQPPIGIAVGRPRPLYPPNALGNVLGVNQHYSQGMSHSFLPLLRELGVKWVRDTEPWSRIEPARGQYVFSDSLQKRLRFYEENDISLVFVLFGSKGNPGVYPDNPYDAAAYGRLAAAVARKLEGEYDLDFVLELWNEPHNFGLRDYFGGTWNAAPPSPWVDHYLSMVREAVSQVHAYNPAIRTFTCEDVIPAHYRFLELGLPPELAGFAIHPYGGVTPELLHYGPDADWAQPFTILDEDRSMKSLVNRLRAAGERKLGHTPDIIVTEWGRPVAPVPGHPDWKVYDEEVVAQELPRLYITMVASGVSIVQWFTLADWAAEEGFGLVDGSGGRRQTFHAFKTLSLELGNYELIKQVAGADHPTRGTQAYLFRRMDGRHKLAVWDIDGEKTVVIDTDKAAGDEIRAVDYLGDELQFSIDGQRIALTIGPGIAYIEGLGSSPTVIVSP